VNGSDKNTIFNCENAAKFAHSVPQQKWMLSIKIENEIKSFDLVEPVPVVAELGDLVGEIKTAKDVRNVPALLQSKISGLKATNAPGFSLTSSVHDKES